MAVLEIEGRRVEVDDSFKDLSPEQQAATVDEIASSMNISPAQGFPANSFPGQMNAGIADTVGGMVDFINPFDKPHMLNPFPEGTGSAKTGLRNVFQGANAAVATEDPQTLLQSLGRGTGEAVAAFGPTVGALRAVAAQGGAAGAAAQEALKSLLTKGGFGAEAVAGGISQAGADTAERAGYGPLAQGLAAVGAPVAAYPVARAAGALGRAAVNYSPTAAAIRGVKSAVAPFTEMGARGIVEDAVKSQVADPDRAIARLEGENLGNLSPAQQTGEPGLMALERGFAERNPKLQEDLTRGVDTTRSVLSTAAREGAQGRTIKDTREFFKERAETHLKFLTNLKTRAEKQADAALRETETSASPMAMSAAVKQKLDLAYEQASKREAALWSKVPKQVEIQTAQARAAFQDALEETTDVSADSIPGKAARFLGEEGFGETVTMARLHRLYSEMRKAAREANAQVVPDEFRARQANRIADAILQDIEATDPQGAARLLADARAYSASMNQTFSANAVSGAMAVQRSGADRIPETLILDRTVGAGGRAGAQSVDEIRGALGGQADMEIQEYLKDTFTKAGVRGDRLDPARAENFIRSNEELLQRFPDGLQVAIQDATAAAKKADRRGSQLDAAVKYLGDKNAPGMIGVINSKVGQVVAKTIFDAENPAASARALVAAAKRDKTGDAYLGLKGGVFDEIIKNATVKGKFRGAALSDQLDNPDVAKVLREVMSPEEQARLRQIAAQLRKVDQWETVSPEEIRNAPNQLIATFLQVKAAEAGRAMGTGTIQTPGIFVNRTRDLANRLAVNRADRLLYDAMRDPKLLAALLAGPGSKKAVRDKAESTIAAWAAGAAASTGDFNEQGPQ